MDTVDGARYFDLIDIIAAKTNRRKVFA